MSTVQQAAAEIVALIHSNPRSPRQEQIEAVIAKAVLSHQEPAPDPRLMEWHNIVAAFRAALELEAGRDAQRGGCRPEAKDEADAMLDVLDAHARAVWATPVLTFADVALRAAIARDWNTPGSIGDPEYPRWVLRQGDNASIDDLALAHVVQSVLQLPGHARQVASIAAGGIPAIPTEAATSPLAQDIRTLIPKLQAALIAQRDADERAILEKREPQACPMWRAATSRAADLDAELDDALSQQLWHTPVRNFDDLLLRAEIAQHHACDWPTSSDGLEDPGAYSLWAYGEVAMAVLAMGGRPFSRHGSMPAFARETEARQSC